MFFLDVSAGVPENPDLQRPRISLFSSAVADPLDFDRAIFGLRGSRKTTRTPEKRFPASDPGPEVSLEHSEQSLPDFFGHRRDLFRLALECQSDREYLKVDLFIILRKTAKMVFYALVRGERLPDCRHPSPAHRREEPMVLVACGRGCHHRLYPAGIR